MRRGVPIALKLIKRAEVTADASSIAALLCVDVAAVVGSPLKAAIDVGHAAGNGGRVVAPSGSKRAGVNAVRLNLDLQRVRRGGAVGVQKQEPATYGEGRAHLGVELLGRADVV